MSLTVQPDPSMVFLRTELNHLRREVRGKYDFQNIIRRLALRTRPGSCLSPRQDDNDVGKRKTLQVSNYRAFTKESWLLDSTSNVNANANNNNAFHASRFTFELLSRSLNSFAEIL